jgi:hypothetical protein
LFLNPSIILHHLADPVLQVVMVPHDPRVVAVAVSYTPFLTHLEVAAPGLPLVDVLPINPMDRVMGNIFLEVGTTSLIELGI